MMPDPITANFRELPVAQADMRAGYCSGGAGVLASSLAWFVAALIASFADAQSAVWALFIGGMLIHPVGILIAKIAGRRGNHSSGNPLAALAMANTVWLICSLPLAYVVSLQRVDWFFPAMLLIIGGRYLTFQLMFGLRIYWALGAALIVAAIGLVKTGAAPATSAFFGAGIELLFAAWLLRLDGKIGQKTD